jgi:hypothetical protein
MNPTIKAALNNTISTLENKSRETSEADFNVKTASDRAAAAQKKIGTSEAKVDAHQTSLDNVNSKIATPPMKEVSTGGKNGGTKKVVDDEELAKLQNEKKNITGLITQARTEVENARQEAEATSTEALQAAGIKQETIQEASELQNRVASMQKTLSEGGKVSDQDLQKLATDINTFSGKLNKEDNKGDVLGNAVYDPLVKGLKNIIKTIEKKESQPDPNAPPPEGSVNRKLFDIGIKGDPQAKIIRLMEKAAERNLQIDQGKTFTKDEMKTMFNDYKTLTNGLTDAQKNSEVIKGFKTDMEALVTKSGHGDILTEGGG